ncbi:hypothetical protein F971_03160 [Acinetobacter vivianii]|uniref:Carrier domain-containing protein n=1 Tax=Acinetobacter vivianii TaxID=1776742 RepID=N8W9U7_9GAMM|nr:hypothetical protein F971_03160 [Acinetobacter vivianii]
MGKPIGNTKVYLLDSQGEPVPVGVVGELYIGGVQVARGYLNRPELTSERFLQDPFSREVDARMYRTGDIARWLADGNIEYLGRNDEQVKIRGFRIEPGEIATQLMTYPEVKDAVVLACGEGDQRHLTAWWIATDEMVEVDSSDLHNWLASELPDYMVPRGYVRVESFPLTPNGKLDRKALPVPNEESLIRGVYEAPQGEKEQLLSKHWCELLGIERVSRHDSFFMLGGNSLLAVRLVSRLRGAGYHLGLQQIFAHPDLLNMAEMLVVVEIDLENEDRALLVRSGNEGNPIFFLPSGFGDYSYVYGLSNDINSERPIYALPWPMKLIDNNFNLNQLIEYAVNLLKTIQPKGPYTIIGYSSGGVLAWMMADYLLNVGEKVIFVGMIDTLFPLPLGNKGETFQYKESKVDLIDWGRVGYYSKLIENISVECLKTNIYLFKAQYESEVNLSYIEELKSLGYSRDSDSALLWDSVAGIDNINVKCIQGDHFSILTNKSYREKLGRAIKQALDDIYSERYFYLMEGGG